MTTAPASGRDGSARDTILARLREALRTPAPLPHLKSHAAAPASSAPNGLPRLSVLPEQVARPWLPEGGETPDERLAILVENLGKLRALVYRVPDLTAAADLVGTLSRERDWKQVAWHDHPLVAPLRAGIPCGTYEVRSGAFDKSALEACDAGITACEALVAQTGSILVSSATCGGRALSILPHVHVVIATCDQIVATLGDALHFAQERSGGRMPSMLSFITGPSRTGDIERILVLGAHGPKELVVILVE
ncbi:MAG: lactate utilization protein [Planctomycetia bacterium]